MSWQLQTTICKKNQNNMECRQLFPGEGNGTYSTGSNYMQVVDRKQKYCLEWLYLFHKLLLWVLCVLYSSYWLLFRVSQSFTGGLQPPCPSQVATPMILIMIEIQNSGTALLIICGRNNRIMCPTYAFIVLRFIASYVQPVMQQYESTTF